MILRTFLRGTLLIRLVLVLSVLAFAAAAPAAHAGKSKKPKPVPTAPSKKQAKFEKDFLMKMMDRHQRGINLAIWIDSQTTETTLKAYLAEFINQEQAEIYQMQNWLVEWCKISYAPKNRPVDDEDLEDLLDAEDEVEFMLEALGMIKGYYKNEIAQMKDVSKKAFHQELNDFAARNVQMDRQEVAMLSEVMKQLDEESDD